MDHRYQVSLHGQPAIIEANSAPHAWQRYLAARKRLDGLYGLAIPKDATVVQVDNMGPSELHDYLVRKHPNVPNIECIVACAVVPLTQTSDFFSSDQLRIMAEALVADAVNRNASPTTAVKTAFAGVQDALHRYRDTLLSTDTPEDWRAVPNDLENFQDVIFELQTEHELRTS